MYYRLQALGIYILYLGFHPSLISINLKYVVSNVKSSAASNVNVNVTFRHS